jgi:hypothetical protein
MSYIHYMMCAQPCTNTCQKSEVTKITGNQFELRIVPTPHYFYSVCADTRGKIRSLLKIMTELSITKTGMGYNSLSFGYLAENSTNQKEGL